MSTTYDGLLDIIQGVQPQWLDDLGMPRRRDPDALPPRNIFEAAMNYIYRGTVALRGGNTLFAIKAAVLTGKIFDDLQLCKVKSILGFIFMYRR